MAPGPVIVLLTSLYFFHELKGSSAESKTFLPLCSRTCNTSTDFRENALFSHQCSCSKSCSVYEDCCYDSPYKNTARSRLGFACMSVVGLGHIRAVVTCPRSWRGDSCRTLLGHLPPVTSRVTNVTYGNVFCASCNEDGDDLIRWNVQLRCSRNSDLHDFDFDFTQIKYNWGKFWGRNARGGIWRPCQFHTHYDDFEILRDLELRPCVVPSKVSRCSQTWRGLSVEQKCRSYEDPVYVGNTAFRNSHCAECNFQNKSHARCIPSYVQELLDLEIVDGDYVRFCMAVSPYKCISDMGKGTIYSLSFLFDGTEPTVIECIPPSGRLCCRGERYDDMTGKCRTIRRG